MSTSRTCDCGDPRCDCCSGLVVLTPRPTENRPGLDALAYRVGTHGAFLQTMKGRLALHGLDEGGAELRPLAALGTRDGSDPAIALLDAAATVADVLSFYQERIANEGYLRTATEDRSLHELARLVGYRPRPGVAASVYLAYTIDANTAGPVTVPKGSRVQTVPGPDELPQSFETGEDLEARAAWNRLRPRTAQPQRLTSVHKRGSLRLRGANTGVNVGDPLLLVDGAARSLVRVTAVAAVPGLEPGQEQSELTIEDWASPPASTAAQEAALKRVAELVAAAPAGVVAKRVAARVAAATADGRLSPAGGAVLKESIDGELRSLGALPATNLRPWLGKLRVEVEAASNASRVRLAAPELAKGDEGDAHAQVLTTLVQSLTQRPSKPLPHPLQLPRKIDFAATGDSSLQLTAAIAPALRDTLGAALGGVAGQSSPAQLEVYAFRVKSGVFGRNAPKRQRLVRRTQGTDESSFNDPIGEWPIIETQPPDHLSGGVSAIKEAPDALHLESSQPGILPGSWVVVDASAIEVLVDDEPAMVLPAEKARGVPLVTRAAAVQPKVSRAEYGVSGETTRLALEDDWLEFHLREFDGDILLAARAFDFKPGIAIERTQAVVDRDFRVVRQTTVYAASERLELAEEVIDAPLCGTDDDTGETLPVELDGLYADLQPGRYVVIAGERADVGEGTAVAAAEPLMITRVVHDVRDAEGPLPWRDTPPQQRTRKLPGDTLHTFVWFDKPPRYCFRRAGVTIYGNVIKATHGETRRETLGGGDGTRAGQRFTLKQPPLTHLAAATPEGAQSTLQVWVDDLRWHERRDFVDAAPTDRVYVTKLDPEGRATVIFGNGVEGARLSSGLDNVKAEYRFGIGMAGNARAGQISQLSTRPLGVKEVINPLRASGGADAERRDQIRRNAPNAVMALGRLVSTQDYADFARGFAGIGKAAAVELSDGRRRVVHVTIAGADDAPIDPDSDLFVNLGRALRELGDPFQPVDLVVRDLLVLIVSAGLRIHPDHRWESVVTDVRARLLDGLSFERRELGQDVSASEVLALMQSVRGVQHVDLDLLGALPSTVADPLAQDGRRPLTPDEIAERVTAIVEAGMGAPVAPRIAVWPARRMADGLLPAQLAVLRPEVPATLVLNQIT